MEHGARLSTSRVLAISFIFMALLIVLSLAVNVIQGINNYRLQNEQRTAVTPMGFNASFAVSQNSADASYLQQMALSFIALRLNVSSETVDASHQALLQYIRPGAQNQMKVILAEEARRIKADNVNSAFFPDQCQGLATVWPRGNSRCAENLDWRFKTVYRHQTLHSYSETGKRRDLAG